MTNPRIARDTPPQEPEQRPAAQLKNTLRADLLARRKALDPKGKRISDELIGRRLLDWCTSHAVTSLGVYHPIRGEPDLLFAYNALAAHGVHLALPVVVGKNAPLEFRRWLPGDPLEKDALGTLVPAVTSPLMQPQALLVPCVGYNAAQCRLGYGGGFYDRTLAASQRPMAVGVCYAFGLVEFTGESHDMSLDLVLTDAV
ncbi:5-formyltetrahydrofolate cyclo-ligase [Herbaspirillum sp. LeCh32-8]|uniref:5-formyltetrahydrofolate cyclo-ligase n=1 Tax=Herbaspirillum sp. LeCh32-8 TaxID=2821356 RepID=UPI001AE726F5|nr:5-formyltetrahydrofolate cyclo-ligase [Herbaspirillum sp. LeCh32-8]MBP0600635.1 5-formyltetrahydrofolate cyclo-ligase [Herbaspirillum sp. LeCh32-8]